MVQKKRAPRTGAAVNRDAARAESSPKRQRLARNGSDPRRAGSGARGTQASDAPGAVYIEGWRAAEEALQTGFPIKRAILAENDRDQRAVQLAQHLGASGVPVVYAPRADLDALSNRGAHQGVILEAGSFPYVGIEDVIADAGTGAALVVLLDHVTDEGNVGAIARSAEVVGASGLVIANKRAAGVGAGTFKASAGAVMHLPIARVPNLPRAIDQLKEAGFWVVGATEHAEATCWDAPLDGRIALVMGSEGEGLSHLVQQRCDTLAKLPQRGSIESLNVAQATTVLCYEWMRRSWDAIK